METKKLKEIRNKHLEGLLDIASNYLVEGKQDYEKYNRSIINFFCSLGAHNVHYFTGELASDKSVYCLDKVDGEYHIECFSSCSAPKRKVVSLDELKAIIEKYKEDMETKTLKITVPDGYEIDKENSTFECIKFKKKKQEVKKWDDLKRIEGFYISDTNVCIYHATCSVVPTTRQLFLTEKHAKSALAMAQISQLLPYYCEPFTDEEWKNIDIPKYCLCRKGSVVFIVERFNMHAFLSFRTATQAEEFYKNNKQLVEDYLMIEQF